MKRRRVVGLGLCVVDQFYRVDALGAESVRTYYDAECTTPGGHIGNALRQVTALGCRASVLSALGDDAHGRFVRSALRSAGVDTRRLLHSPRLRTTVAVVLVDRRNGERRFVLPRRAGMEARAPRLDLSGIDRDTVLLVDAHFPKDALRAVKRAQACGARVVGDFHRLTDNVRALLPWVDHAIVSHELVSGAGFASPRDALVWLGERTRDVPVVTQGRRGGLWLDGRRFRRYAAQRVKVVDTTGAGDVFHGAFAAGQCMGLPFETCLEVASRAAAGNCTALGGAARLMTPAELPASARSSTRRSSSRSRRGR